MASAKEFKHASIEDTESIENYLNELVKGFQKKEISFKNNEEEIVMNPKGLIDFDIKAKSKDGKSKVYIKLSWKERDKNETLSKNLEIN